MCPAALQLRQNGESDVGSMDVVEEACCAATEPTYVEDAEKMLSFDRPMPRAVPAADATALDISIRSPIVTLPSSTSSSAPNEEASAPITDMADRHLMLFFSGVLSKKASPCLTRGLYASITWQLTKPSSAGFCCVADADVMTGDN